MNLAQAVTTNERHVNINTIHVSTNQSPRMLSLAEKVMSIFRSSKKYFLRLLRFLAEQNREAIAIHNRNHAVRDLYRDRYGHHDHIR